MGDSTRLGAGTLGLAAEVEQLVAGLSVDAASAEQAARTGRIIERFAAFATVGCGLSGLDQVTAEAAGAFLKAARVDGSSASVSTMHWRRTALRLLFREARKADLASGDPTLDVELPPRSSLSVRPLTDDEIAVCRSAAQWSLTGHRRSAIWALAEATCRSSEIPHITPADVDLATGSVSIHGGKVTDDRVGQLTEWGLARVQARISGLEAPGEPLAYAGGDPDQAGQVASSTAVAEVLVRAGLHDEPDVRPGSVAAWAGRGLLNETGRIDLAARALGVRSLDRAAEIVAWDWRADA